MNEIVYKVYVVVVVAKKKKKIWGVVMNGWIYYDWWRWRRVRKKMKKWRNFGFTVRYNRHAWSNSPTLIKKDRMGYIKKLIGSMVDHS